MLVIKLIVVAAVIAAFAVGVTMFNHHCTAKFGHAFFTKKAFYIGSLQETENKARLA